MRRSVVFLCLLLAFTSAEAQLFRIIHNFTGEADGVFPIATLTLAGNNLYGTTVAGGTNENGTVFKTDLEGSYFTTLETFGGLANGASPYAGLVFDGATLYGTTDRGGTNDTGTLFRLNTDGSEYTVLKSFSATINNGSGTYTNMDGAYPVSNLLLKDSMLYGTTSNGGTNGDGTVFQINTNGSGYRVIWNFKINPEGAYPVAGLASSGGTLYGTTPYGGDSGSGTVFSVNTNGAGFTVIKSFSRLDSPWPFFYTNSDGARPSGGVVLNGITLYGTTERGGSSGNGTIFKVNTDGTGFTNLYVFSPTGANSTNGDGALPSVGLVSDGRALYGTTLAGGPAGNGTVFTIHTDGTGFTVLYSFSDLVNGTNSDGAAPYASLIVHDHTLYGTTQYGGSTGSGTVFRLELRTPLSLWRVGNQVVLSWTNAALGLQSAPALPGPYTNISGAISPYTNNIIGSQQFFRLIGN